MNIQQEFQYHICIQRSGLEIIRNHSTSPVASPTMSDAETSDEKDPYDCDGDDPDHDKDFVPEPIASKSRKQTTKKSIKYLDSEKKKLGKLVDGEEIIWNLQNKQHSNSNAVAAAWKRVSGKMNRSGMRDYFLQD